MRIEQLQYFVEVAQCNNVSLVAKKHYTSQPTISQSIKALEKELGVTLFIRKNKGVELTQAGKDLLPMAETMLERASSMLNYNKTQQQQQDIYINTTPQSTYLFSHYLYPLFTENALYNSHLHIAEATSPELLSNIQKNKADIAFGFSRKETLAYRGQLAKQNDCVVELLFETSMKIAMHNENPIAAQNIVTTEQLYNTPMLLLDSMLRVPDGPMIRDNNIVLYEQFNTFSSCLPILDILSHNQVAAAILPTYFLDTPIFQSLPLKMIDVNPANNVMGYLIYHNKHSEAVEDALNIFRTLKDKFE